MPDTESPNRAMRVIAEAKIALDRLGELDTSFWLDLVTHIESRTGRIVLTGIGKSGYIAMKVTATLTSLGHHATFVHPVEALHGDSGMLGNGDIIIVFSFSGGTKELLQFVRHALKNFKVTVIGVTGNKNSELATLADAIVPIVINAEGCPIDLAPMASTTAMLVAGDAIAASLTSPQRFTRNDFARFHPNGILGLELLSVEDRAMFTSDVFVLNDMPLQMVLKRMGEVGKGIVAVVDGADELVGTITDGDIRRFFTAATSLDGICAKDVMTVDPKYVAKEENLKNTLSLMELHKVTSIFVVNERKNPIGIIHIHDIIES